MASTSELHWIRILSPNGEILYGDMPEVPQFVAEIILFSLDRHVSSGMIRKSNEIWAWNAYMMERSGNVMKSGIGN